MTALWFEDENRQTLKGDGAAWHPLHLTLQKV